MSEFKFACPVCGQHITADASAAGKQLNCPTCFRKIIIPQPPAGSDSKLILSAVEANRPRPPQSPSVQFNPFGPRKRSVWSGLIALLILAGIATAAIVAVRSGVFSTPQASAPTRPPAPDRGAIGVGAWNTQVEYSDIVVTKGHKVLYRSEFHANAPGWHFGHGNWIATNGVLAQTAIATDCRATFGNSKWHDYTLNLNARKLGGQEGFLILFNVADDQNWTWWNLGGWKNTRNAIETCSAGKKSTIGPSIPARIDSGRWYQVRVELHGRRVRCYLNNKLIEEAEYPFTTSDEVSALH